MKTEKTLKEHLTQAGKVKTPAKAKSSAKNGKKGGRPSQMAKELKALLNQHGIHAANNAWRRQIEDERLTDSEHALNDLGGRRVGRTAEDAAGEILRNPAGWEGLASELRDLCERHGVTATQREFGEFFGDDMRWVLEQRK